MSVRSPILIFCLWVMLPSTVLAWNPYPDVSNPPPEERSWKRPKPTTQYRAPLARPTQYVTPASRPTMPSFATPTPSAPRMLPPPPSPVFAAAPAPMSYAPPPSSPRQVPMQQYESPAPVAYTPPPAEPMTMEAAPPPRREEWDSAAAYGYKEPVSQDPTHHWALGVEGYFDNYQEKDIDVKTEGNYAGLFASYDYYSRHMSDIYLGVDLRAAFGESNYSSGSGRLVAVPESEYEARLKAGFSTIDDDGKGFVYYSGLGARYYRDDLGGEVTSLGALGYDRNILQIYVPIGLDWHKSYNEWDVVANMEYDHLLAGYVSSRLGNIPGLENMMNHQDKGWGLRTSIMFGQTFENGLGYAFGPYLRYWSVDDSDIDHDSTGGGGLEPNNQRLQYGASLKFLF